MKPDHIKLDQILGEYFCQQNKINTNHNYKIKEIDAKELIVSERIDLIEKLKYIECRGKNYDLKYIKKYIRLILKPFPTKPILSREMIVKIIFISILMCLII